MVSRSRVCPVDAPAFSAHPIPWTASDAVMFALKPPLSWYALPASFSTPDVGFSSVVDAVLWSFADNGALDCSSSAIEGPAESIGSRPNKMRFRSPSTVRCAAGLFRYALARSRTSL